MYKGLGALSMVLLLVALGLSIFILTGQHSKRRIYLVSGTVFALMITVTIFCMLIYLKYGGAPASGLVPFLQLR